MISPSGASVTTVQVPAAQVSWRRITLPLSLIHILLYWRPAVDYHGASRVLAALFRRNLWRFQSYETLAERLSSLRWELGRPTAAAAAAQNWPEPCLRLIRDLSQSCLLYTSVFHRRYHCKD